MSDSYRTAESSKEITPPGTRKKFLVLTGLFLLILFALILWWKNQIDPSGSPGKSIALTIPQGSSPSYIAALLEEKKIIKSSTAFSLYVKLKGAEEFLAGNYSFRKDESFGELVEMLQEGPKLTVHKITVPEGYRLDQFASLIEKRLPGRSRDVFLRVVQSKKIRSSYLPNNSSELEGLLFPDTYFFATEDNEEDILREMVANFEQVGAEIDLDDSKSKTGFSPYETIIVASLVEREAKRDQDRGEVARVIYNRLEKNMPLQIDATLLYARGEHKNRVLNKDTEIDSPYNTYKHTGLPPTPIASPGRLALEAALNPASGNFLYYVTINDCTAETVFSRTYAEHQKNVARRKRENC